jgi:hypothetical protein
MPDQETTSAPRAVSFQADIKPPFRASDRPWPAGQAALFTDWLDGGPQARARGLQRGARRARRQKLTAR